MSIIRKRSAAQKSYIPGNARDNQYILAEFPLSDELINNHSNCANNTELPYFDCYQNLSKTFFDLCDQHEIVNGQFIANDKLARVRYNQEMHQWQTNQQIYFFYNPANHQLQKSFFDGKIKAKKITLLLLASGCDIRHNAALFHAKVVRIISLYAKQIGIDLKQIRLRDHQHITYDLFAKQKGCLILQTHKFRSIGLRYEQQHFPIEKSHSSMTYAIVNVPITNHLLNITEVDPDSKDPYNPLYTFITDAYTQAAKRYNLNNGALIANGLVPIVRHSENEEMSINGELQFLGYNPKSSPCGLISKWNAQELVDSVQLVFVATEENEKDSGYAKFLNQIEQAIRLLVTELEIAPQKEEIMVRFHQHISYNLA